MYDLTSPKVIRYLADLYGFHFKKGLGQNFLTDASVLTAIAAEAGTEGVLEIGPGFGVLTQELAQHAQKVVAVELDDALLPVLADTLAAFSNVQVVHGDIMKLNVPALLAEAFGGMAVSVAANLPYYITTPILMMLLEQKLPVENIVVMIQKEVADRLLASPGSKAYGAITVAVQYYAEAERIVDVPADRFVPQPKVDSTVVRLKIRKTPPVAVDEKAFFRLVKQAFSQRRKTLCNALAAGGSAFGTKEQLKEALFAMHINENVRGESLSIEQFAKLLTMLTENS